MSNLNYEQALAWIHGIARFGMNQGLERIETLLDLLGNPHRACKYLHIGGTNGKGSTAAFVAAILEKAGYRVGLYTSPYLVQFTNRMAVNGSDIPREQLVDSQQGETLVEKSPPISPGSANSFSVTALAFCFCSRATGYRCWRWGLGGRLDATNVSPWFRRLPQSAWSITGGRYGEACLEKGQKQGEDARESPRRRVGAADPGDVPGKMFHRLGGILTCNV